MAAIANCTKPSVTLVDDEPAILDILSRAARSFSFDCQLASSAEAAVALLEKHPTPVVVTDLRMPGRGGLWLVREIQRRWPEIAVIVITVGVEDEALIECLEAGVSQYFLKPIHLDEFHHALEMTWQQQVRRVLVGKQKRYLEKAVADEKRKVRSTFYSAITSLVRTLEARDLYTKGHSMRVRSYADLLAKRIGMDDRERKRLRLAAILHDIGKVGLAEGILNKASRLSDEEFAQIREHPQIGERILRPIVRNRSVLAAIRNHHERFDGFGYPDRLIGEAIPRFARIIAVADSFDAMTSARAYRPALSNDEALQSIEEGCGTQFDPSLVPAFLGMVRETGELLIAPSTSEKPGR
jgi:putative two-component system response regulator